MCVCVREKWQARKSYMWLSEVFVCSRLAWGVFAAAQKQ